MKDNKMSNKLKRERSSSRTSHFTISDDESPIHSNKSLKKNLDVRRHHHKKQKHNHKHSRRHHSDDDGIKCENKLSGKTERHSPQVRVKEEPPSEDERDRKYKNRHTDQSRHSRSESSRSRPPVSMDSLSSKEEPEWGKKDIKKENKEAVKNNAKPDFGLSGKLTEDANTFNGVVIKYSEPPEARRPKRRWRLYPFKGESSLPILHIHRQSAYLLGRDRKVADIPIDHPSCSKQHAALQYRLVPFTRSDGSSCRQIKLYVIDLESANGTYLNNQKIDPKKYYEMKERDVIKFGYSSREYVLLHEHSKDSEEDDNVHNED